MDLAEIDERLKAIACGDSACVVRRPRGMATNRGCRCMTGPHAREALILRQRQEEALRGMIEGRTTPPTDAEIATHAATGGLWACTTKATHADPQIMTMRARADIRYHAHSHREGKWMLRWIAVDASGKPCAWPAAKGGE